MSSAIAVQPYKSQFYLNFRSPTVQRWAAKEVKGGNYYALTPSLWRKMGLTGLPEGVVGRTTHASTIYFGDEQSADRARTTFLKRLHEEGVLK